MPHVALVSMTPAPAPEEPNRPGRVAAREGVRGAGARSRVRPLTGASVTSSSTLKVAYSATIGWDYATGLGSVNAYQLVHAWGGCDIGGKPYAAGAANASNACQTCSPANSVSSFTALADGTTCGTGKFCNGGACLAGCIIGGTFYVSGAPKPGIACQVCAPSTSTSAWASATDGTACSDGVSCTQNDHCTGGVCGGAAYACTPGVCEATSACNGADASAGDAAVQADAARPDAAQADAAQADAGPDGVASSDGGSADGSATANEDATIPEAGSESGLLPESGPLADGAPSAAHDAAAASDAGSPEAGATDDASSNADAGGGKSTRTSQAPGCGCRVTGASPAPPSGAWLAVFGAALGVSRRRRSRSRHR